MGVARRYPDGGDLHKRHGDPDASGHPGLALTLPTLLRAGGPDSGSIHPFTETPATGWS
jgi:hypothetical protein